METDIIPLGERAQKTILDYVVAVGDAAETTYLEVKSELDPASKLGVAKVAKFLLGVANRLPKDAARHFRGYAVLVIGAQKGAANGITRGTEPHDLENRLKPYLGPQFPAFEFGRFAVSETKEVLFIVGQPPQEGQAMFPCHKEFQNDDRRNSLEDGAIYFRGASNTRSARAGEVLALVERGRNAGKSPINLEIGILGSINRVGRVDEAMQRLYDIEEQRFIERQQTTINSSSMAVFLPTVGGASLPASNGASSKRLEEWKAAKSEHIAEGRLHLLGVSLPGAGIRVTSRDRFVAKPHLIVTFHDCEVLDHHDVEDADMTKLVERVIPRQNPFGINFASPNLGVLSHSYPVRWKSNGADVVVALTPESFRPDVPWESDQDDFVVLARDAQASTVTVSWALTEEGNDTTTTGEIEVSAGVLVDAFDLVRETFLGNE